MGFGPGEGFGGWEGLPSDLSVKKLSTKHTQRVLPRIRTDRQSLSHRHMAASSSSRCECALTSADGLQGSFNPAAQCPFNKGAADEAVIGCFACGRYCCSRCLQLVSTKSDEFVRQHGEFVLDPAASPALLAVCGGVAARAATDADARLLLTRAGVGRVDEADGMFKMHACALCTRDRRQIRSVH